MAVMLTDKQFDFILACSKLAANTALKEVVEQADGDYKEAIESILLKNVAEINGTASRLTGKYRESALKAMYVASMRMVLRMRRGD